jgi:hypothetical protein
MRYLPDWFWFALLVALTTLALLLGPTLTTLWR